MIKDKPAGHLDDSAQSGFGCKGGAHANHKNRYANKRIAPPIHPESSFIIYDFKNLSRGGLSWDNLEAVSVGLLVRLW